LDDPGIESRCGEIFRTYPDRLRGPPSLLYNGYRVFPGGKGDGSVMLTTYPLLVPRLRKSWAIPPLTIWVLLGLLRGSLYPLHNSQFIRGINFISIYMFRLIYRAIFRLVFRVVCMYSFWCFGSYDISYYKWHLTLNLLKTTIVAPPCNAIKWQMGFNSAFKGLKYSWQLYTKCIKIKLRCDILHTEY
jgi:hypothetical protein